MNGVIRDGTLRLRSGQARAVPYNGNDAVNMIE